MRARECVCVCVCVCAAIRACMGRRGRGVVEACIALQSECCVYRGSGARGENIINIVWYQPRVSIPCERLGREEISIRMHRSRSCNLATDVS